MCEFLPQTTDSDGDGGDDGDDGDNSQPALSMFNVGSAQPKPAEEQGSSGVGQGWVQGWIQHLWNRPNVHQQDVDMED